MKRVGYAVAAAIGALTAYSAPAGHAADLPTKKEAAPPPPVNCFASIWSYLDSTAADCPR